MLWTVVKLGVAVLFLQTRKVAPYQACVPFNHCIIPYGSEMTATPVIAPGNIDGLDLTADDAILKLSEHWAATKLFHQAFTLKFYVRFDDRAMGKDITFVDIPNVATLERRSDGVFVVNYDFLNLNNDIVKRGVVLKDENWISLQAIGMKLRVERAKRDISTRQSKWTMLCFNFEKRDEGVTMTYYIDGRKINVDSGDMSGLFRLAGSPVFKNAVLSTVNIVPLNSSSCMSEDFPACAIFERGRGCSPFNI